MALWSQYHDIFRVEHKPFAFVDMDAFDANLAALAARCGSKMIRVATKSIRCLDLIKRVAEHTKVYGLMCFTAPEAVWLAQEGLDNLMVAYPTLQEEDIRAVCTQVRAGKTIYLMTDNREHLDIINAIAASEDVVLPVCLDVDVSMDVPGIHFGVYRSSITSPELLRAYLAHAQTCTHLRVAGVMTYDAQIAGVTDTNNGQNGLYNGLVSLLKRKSLPKIHSWRAEAVQILREAGVKLDYFNGGGTGSLEYNADDASVTEVTFGSGLYMSTLFDGYQLFRHTPAAGFVVEIVRHPQAEVYTALGGGYIASGSPGWAKVPSVVYPEGAKMVKDEGAGEVQTPLRVSGSLNWPHDNFAIMRHAKAGEYCERFNELVLLRGGKIERRALTYRGHGKCFL